MVTTKLESLIVCTSTEGVLSTNYLSTQRQNLSMPPAQLPFPRFPFSAFQLSINWNANHGMHRSQHIDVVGFSGWIGLPYGHLSPHDHSIGPDRARHCYITNPLNYHSTWVLYGSLGWLYNDFTEVNLLTIGGVPDPTKPS